MLVNLQCWLMVDLGIQMCFKKDSFNSNLILHCVLAILLRCSQVIASFEKSTNQTLYFSDCTVPLFGVHLVMKYWFNQTLCVSCFTKINSCISMIGAVNQLDNMC